MTRHFSKGRNQCYNASYKRKWNRGEKAHGRALKRKYIMTNKSGFKTVDWTEDSELEEPLKGRRIKLAIWIVLIILVVVVGINLLWELRTYSDYDVQLSKESADSAVKKYANFKGKIVEYSNDGILCRDREWNLSWNEAFEMASPYVDVSANYIIVYDRDGTQLYLLNEKGLVKKVEMAQPIIKAKVADTGVIAILTQLESVAYVKLLSSEGKEISNGEFYEKGGSFPIDVAITSDGRILAVNLIDLSEADVCSTIQFYNFGSVGQNEVNNMVSSYRFSGEIYPEIYYNDRNRLIAVGADGFVTFSGKQVPEKETEYQYQEQLQSLIYNDSYVAMVYSNQDEDQTYHIKVVDYKGKVVMEQDTALPYRAVEFLDNDEICIRSQYACEIYSIHGVRKFSYTFDKELYKIISGGDRQSYTVVLEKQIDEVRLK